jgi:hypothetical protein
VFNVSTVAVDLLLGVAGGKGFTGGTIARIVGDGLMTGPERFLPIQSFL